MFYGKPLIEETEIEINYGNRYEFIRQHSSVKSTIIKYPVARAIIIPDNINIYFWDDEAGDKTAILPRVHVVIHGLHLNAAKHMFKILNHRQIQSRDTFELTIVKVYHE